jgi:hypothetical protein
MRYGLLGKNSYIKVLTVSHARVTLLTTSQLVELAAVARKNKNMAEAK